MSTPFTPPAWWSEGMTQPSIPVNDNALRFWITQNDVDNSTTSQPGSPADGDAYIIQATHTGAQWSTFDPDDVAIFFDGNWTAFAPVDGMRVSVSGDVYVYDAGWVAAGGGGGSTAPVNSILINGAFQVNQLVKSGTVTLSAGEYGHDGWKAGASGCTYTFSTSGAVTTLTIGSGSLQQIAEGANIVTGTYTLAWSGSAQGKIGGGSYSASGVTGSLTGGSNVTVEFNTGTLTQVQLVPGSVAPAFRSRTFAQELESARVYFQKSWDYGTAVGTPTQAGMQTMHAINGPDFYYGTVQFPCAMRAVPTVNSYSSETGTISKGYDYIATADVDVTAVAPSTNLFRFRSNSNALTSDHVYGMQWTADARL